MSKMSSGPSFGGSAFGISVGLGAVGVGGTAIAAGVDVQVGTGVSVMVGVGDVTVFPSLTAIRGSQTPSTRSA